MGSVVAICSAIVAIVSVIVGLWKHFSRVAQYKRDEANAAQKEQIEALSALHPTPFYVYDERGIRASARRLIDAFSWNPGFREYFGRIRQNFLARRRGIFED